MTTVKVGLQLYSLREEIKAYGLITVLNEIKKAGFDGVELAGYYDLSAEELKKALDTVALKVCGAHTNLTELTDERTSTLNYADTLGYKNLIIPYMTTTEIMDNLELIKSTVLELTELGYTVGYHNHAHELLEGKDYLKLLIDAIPNLYLETDMFWLTAAGKNAVEYVDLYGERIKWVHLKEMGEDYTDFNPVVGKGRVNAAAIIDKFKDRLDWIVLEVEKMNILYTDYIQQSCKYIKEQISK